MTTQWNAFETEARGIQEAFEETLQRVMGDAYLPAHEKRRKVDEAEAHRRQRVAEVQDKARTTRSKEMQRIADSAAGARARAAATLRKTLGDAIYAAELVRELEGLDSAAIVERHKAAPHGFDAALIGMAGKRILAQRAQAQPGNFETQTALQEISGAELPEIVTLTQEWVEVESWNPDRLDQVAEAERMNATYKVSIASQGVTTLADAYQALNISPQGAPAAEPA